MTAGKGAEVRDSRGSKHGGRRHAAERTAACEQLLSLPEEEEELNADGIQALQEGIEDFKAGRTFTREEIERELGA